MERKEKGLTLYETYNEMSKVVSSTMGAQGRFVALASDGSNKITKDGATVAQALNKVQGLNTHESLCAGFLGDATRSANRLGDGTSNSITLSAEMLKLLREDEDKVVQKTLQLRDEVEFFTEKLKEHTNKNPKNFETVVDIAGHPDTKELVIEGLRFSENLSLSRGKVGEKTTLEKIEGSYIETDIHPDFHDTFNLKGAGVVLIDGDLNNNTDITAILSKAVQEMGVSSLVIFARGFSEDMIVYMLEANLHSKGALKILPVVSPWIGTKKRAAYYGDIGSITSTTPIKVEDIEGKFSPDNIGKTDVVATTGSILLTNSNKSPEAQRRLESLEKELKEVKNAKKRELEERINLFKGKSAVLKIGAETLSDLEETYLRTLDGVSSGKNFLKEGALRGGGVDLVYLSNKYRKNIPLLSKAVSKSIRVIMSNAKHSEETINKCIEEAKKEENKEKHLNLLEGKLNNQIRVWDATGVIISSLKTATSISTTVARVEAVI